MLSTYLIIHLVTPHSLLDLEENNDTLYSRNQATHKQSYDTLIGGGGGGSLHFFTLHFCLFYGVVKSVVKRYTKLHFFTLNYTLLHLSSQNLSFPSVFT